MFGYELILCFWADMLNEIIFAFPGSKQQKQIHFQLHNRMVQCIAIVVYTYILEMETWFWCDVQCSVSSGGVS